MIIGSNSEKLNNLKTELQKLINESDNPELTALLQAVFDQVDDLAEENALLTQLLIQMKKNMYGRKSEGISADQLHIPVKLGQ